MTQYNRKNAIKMIPGQLPRHVSTRSLLYQPWLTPPLCRLQPPMARQDMCPPNLPHLAHVAVVEQEFQLLILRR